jgi:ABC-type phosphate/phosphonate transport system substrate-binding protein
MKNFLYLNKNLVQYIICVVCILNYGSLLYGNNQANEKILYIGIMQDKRGSAATYRPLIKYFELKGIKIKLSGYSSYRHAAEKFKNGKIDAMFAGSGVAAVMIIKGLAYPLVRPVSKEGWSTYWAVIIVPKSNKDFELSSKYMKSKKIICCALASSGEFYCKSILGKSKQLLIAGNHGNAISALDKHVADIAVVKNRVWDQVKNKYPNLKQIAKDKGENPNNTFIVSSKINKEVAEKIKNIFLGIGKDKSIEAENIKKTMGISKYIITTKKDFSHTIQLLKKCEVDTNYNF